MTLELPTGVTIRLGRDLPDAPPPSLLRVTDQRLGSDWSELSERLHLRTELFRSRHEWEPLCEAPYPDAQPGRE